MSKATKQVKAKKVFRLEATPRGKQLFTYFLSVLAYNGGFTSGRKTMNPKAVSAFFNTATAVNYHAKQGNLEKTKSGIRLTVQGWNYFNGRIAGSVPGQKVEKADLEAMKALIQSGKAPDDAPEWIKTAKVRQITI